MVHHPEQTGRLRGASAGRYRRASVALVPVLCALALAACGGDDPAPAEFGVGGGKPVRLANCDDWNDSSVEERLATVKQIRDFAGGPVGEIPGRGAVLDDDEAYDLLERYCAAEFAGAFKLYKLYIRAAAFIGH